MIEQINFNLEGIPALSIRQPWPWAILHAGKDIENRSWPTKYRGRILIHAGVAFDGSKQDVKDLLSRWSRTAGIETPAIEDLPRGGIVGAADIVDCVAHSDSTWFVGRYGFVLRNVRALPFHPCKGQLSFFKPQFERAA